MSAITTTRSINMGAMAFAAAICVAERGIESDVAAAHRRLERDEAITDAHRPCRKRALWRFVN